jgi:sRNA-binding regulator protein Hfq
MGGADQPRIPGAAGASEQRPQRGPKAASSAASPITEGQLQELVHLAARLQIDSTQLEEQVGKSLSTFTRVEAKEWIKKLRGMADEVAPGTKVRYGQWPEAKEDLEALYLSEQKEAGASFLFKLFNGEEFTGSISDFTAYTIKVKQDNEDVVLRKLAIAYYRRLLTGEEG